MDWLKLNNPAGHLDPGESPTRGCSRVALEETAYQFSNSHTLLMCFTRAVQMRGQWRLDQNPTHSEKPQSA